MISQKIVSPSKIESELLEIWESLSKKNTNRAGLFNLIVYCERSARLGYIRDIVQNLIEKFPSRILFITYEKTAEQSYLKTAVSVMFPPNSEGQVACDSIDIGVGKDDIEKVPYIVTPHLLPDLPIYLFWAENPCQTSKLLQNLQTIADRIIFDSETCVDIEQFAKYILKHISEKKADLVDMNWVRTEDWRDLIAAEFHPLEKLDKLRKIQNIEISYNSLDNLFFQHVKVQSLYVLFWIASRLGWSYQQSEKNCFFFSYDDHKIKASLLNEKNEKVDPGEILRMSFKTKGEEEFSFLRMGDQLESIRIEAKSKQQCELPRYFVIGKLEVGHFLAKEITMKGTSEHFLGVLKLLSKLKT